MAQSALKAQLHDVHFSIALYQIACTKSEHTQIHTYTTHSHYHSNSFSLSLTHTHKHTSKHYPCPNQAQGYYVWVCKCFLATCGTCSTKMLLNSRVFFESAKTELAKRKALLVE